MSPHYRLLSETKQQYAEIFEQARLSLEARLEELRGRFQCEACTSNPPGSVLEPRHAGCGYRTWQAQALRFIEEDVGRELLARLQSVQDARNTVSCHMCGMCCRLASSESSYEELQARAARGDEFARQFASIFLPYASREAAREKYPEVVAAMLAEAAEEAEGEEKIHFYHCPYIGEDNRCTIYGTDKRPAICESYPETPLSFVYEKCAWRPWKDETHAETLATHAMLALCNHYSEQLRRVLAEEGS